MFQILSLSAANVDKQSNTYNSYHSPSLGICSANVIGKELRFKADIKDTVRSVLLLSWPNYGIECKK